MRMLILLCVLLTSISGRSQEFVSKAFLDSIKKVEKSHIGKTFPNFEAKDINGKYFGNASLKGKVTLINFWFKDCAPCIAEFEALNRVYQKFRNNKSFDFISFTFEDSSAINEVTKKYLLQFSVIPVSRQECYRLNLDSGFPTNIIVNQQCNIVFFKSGGATDAKNASTQIDTTIVPTLTNLLDTAR